MRRSAQKGNAVFALVGVLTDEEIAARLDREGLAVGGGRDRRLRRLRARWELDLIGYLNGSSSRELRSMTAALKLDVTEVTGGVGVFRLKLWRWGAALERQGILDQEAAARLQRTPSLWDGRLSLDEAVAIAADGPLPAARAARWPACARWPRPVPELRELPAAPPGSPETLEDLLARVDELIGVRLGTGARMDNKGHYGQLVSDLLGIAASSSSGPDWRGLVELKTLAVVRAAGARWRLKDGPAISMRSVDAQAKLRRVLWIVRIDEGELAGAPVLSWFYQELDPALAAALESSRHLRPKGGAGTTGRGWYLRRDFFTACGLMRSLNGD